MKKIHPVLLGTLMAGVTAATLSVWAADQTVSHDNSKAWRTEKIPEDRTLGHVERSNKLIGREVLTSDNQRFGKIDNIIADLGSGRILYAVIGSGGFLGAGEHLIAVPPMVFTQVPADNSSAIQMSVDKAKLSNAPKFNNSNDKSFELGQREFLDQVYQYFGQQGWWQGGAATSTASFQHAERVNDLVGRKVENVNNEDMGKIDDLALDLPMGRVVYVILTPDSHLNLGDQLYAIPPMAFTWNGTQKTLVSDLTKEKLAGAPHFENGTWVSLSDPTWAHQVYKYYGKQPYFGDAGLEPTGRIR